MGDSTSKCYPIQHMDCRIPIKPIHGHGLKIKKITKENTLSK